MSYGTVQAEKMTTESGYSLGAGNASSFKNRVINGNMEIDQRNAGASFTANDGTFAADRFAFSMTQSSKGTGQNTPSSTETGFATRVAAGFTNYLAFTSSSAYSVVSSDQFAIKHVIEGFNAADLAWGTASAKPITLSFWVYSSLTGTFGGAFQNQAANRSYPFTYTINAANTWEQKTISIAGDTTGTWLTTNSGGIRIWFSLGMGTTSSGTAGAWAGANYQSATGATSVVGTNGATFYLTGVQLEVGTVATSFDFRPYGTELALCQRYYFNNVGTSGQYDYFASGGTYSTSAGRFYKQFPVVMRVPPTFSSTGSGYADGSVFTALSTISAPYITTFGCRIDFTAGAVFASSAAIFLAKDQGTAFAIAFSSEL
jgi:hypothetical protein